MGDKLEGEVGGDSLRGGTKRWWGGQLPSLIPFLTLTVSLPDHDVALVTLAVIRPLRVGALAPAAHPWLLTLVHVCEHTEKS